MKPADIPEAWVRNTRALLLSWFRLARRDFPWRRTKDPWAVLVSEVMLQQTTTSVVAPRWERFLARFPTASSLASALETDVMAEWSGLGYYARARNLRLAALEVVSLGGLPSTFAALRELPGVGPYTAAATASIAFGEPVAALDGNAVRVLSRLLGVERKARSPVAAVTSIAARLVHGPAPGDLNEAVMELGATLCRPVSPDCGTCPVSGSCLARRSGLPDRFPAREVRPKVTTIRLATGLAFRGGRLVLVRDTEFVRGHLAPPLVRLGEAEEAAASLATSWSDLAGSSAKTLVLLGEVTHSVLDRRYRAQVFSVVERRGAPRVRSAGLALARLGEIRNLPHGSFLEKAIGLFRGNRSQRPMRRASGEAAPKAPRPPGEPAQGCRVPSRPRRPGG